MRVSRCATATLLAACLIAPASGAADQVFCEAAKSEALLRTLIASRYDLYATFPDRWAPAAKRLAAMLRADEINFDAMQGRMLRYCASGDHEMAGLVLGEWVGLMLGLEAGGVRES